MGSASVTITSTTGPGITVTSQNFPNVKKLVIDFVGRTVSIDGVYFAFSGIATVTFTISGVTSTIALS